LTDEYKSKQGLNLLFVLRCDGKSSYMKSLNFRDFIDLLETGGELHHIRVEVDAEMEIAAITDRICKSPQNKALLFESVRGSCFRVATNLFGSQQRMALALGLEKLQDLTGWFDRILEALPGASSTEKLDNLSVDPSWHSAAPEICPPTFHLDDMQIDLNSLPILKNHSLDGHPVHGGRFMTLPLVITANPELTEINCGMYRAAVASPDTLVIKWSNTSGAALHSASWAINKKHMPVVIALGGSLALTFAATLPLPAFLDEFTLAGLLQGEPLKVFRCANGLIAPADAEVVIEGYLEPERAASGAFGNHTGFYSPSEPAASVKVTSIRVRSDMIFPATVVGKPPEEDCWLARAGGYLLLSLLKIDVPEVVSLHQPFAGIFHGAAFISVKNAQGRGRELLTAIRKTPWFAGSKLLILVDEEQDPADEAGVFWRIMNSVEWSSDILATDEKISIDATRKPCETRTIIKCDPDMASLVERRWKEYGFES
jgi:4-hydroxy-3-polyprenylbenzoate decarboxylase